MGFNPHPKIAFSLPLSVGTASKCEFMDFMFTQPYDGNNIVAELNKSFPQDLRAIEAYKPKTIFHDIGWARYEIRIETSACSEENAKVIKDAFAGDVIVMKKTKSGVKELNISPLCDIESCDYIDGAIVIKTLLCSSENNFVNPKYVIEHITKTIPNILDDGDYYVCREEVFMDDKVTKFR